MKRLTFEQLQDIEPGRIYMVELSRFSAPEPEVIYRGRTCFRRQGNVVTPLAIDWVAYDLAVDIQETTTNFAPDGKYALRTKGFQALVCQLEIPPAKPDGMTFICPHCGEAGQLRRRTEGAVFTEAVQMRAGGVIWDSDDMFVDVEGRTSFYCGDCGEFIGGVHSEQEMAAWILAIGKAGE